MSELKSPATVMIHVAELEQTVGSCEPHRVALVELAQQLSWTLTVTPVTEPVECLRCANLRKLG